MNGSSFGEMPKPVSSTVSTASAPSARSATRIVPPGGVYLTALFTMIGQHLLDPLGVPVDPDRLSADVDVPIEQRRSP